MIAVFDQLKRFYLFSRDNGFIEKYCSANISYPSNNYMFSLRYLSYLGFFSVFNSIDSNDVYRFILDDSMKNSSTIYKKKKKSLPD